MSKLLIHDYPIQVSPKLAVAIGLNEAIMVQQMHYWLDRSTHFIENRKWIYNTYEGWRKQLPFWSESTIKRTITTLKKKGVIITGNFNKAKFDKTIWYSIDYEVIKQIEEQFYASGQNDLIDNNADNQWSNRTGQNDQTSGSKRTDGEGQNDMTSVSKRPDGEGQNDMTNTIDYTETTTKTTQETTPPKKKTVAVETEEFKKLYTYFEQNINMHQAIKVVDFITEDLAKFGFDLVMYAMEQALLNNKTHYAYIQGVLRRCEAENVTTREQAEFKAKQKKSNYNNNQSKEMTPKWLTEEYHPNTTIKKDDMTPEELEELEKERIKVRKELEAFEKEKKHA